MNHRNNKSSEYERGGPTTQLMRREGMPTKSCLLSMFHPHTTQQDWDGYPHSLTDTKALKPLNILTDKILSRTQEKIFFMGSPK